MKLSTKARYGLRAMLDLAEHYGAGPVQAKAIAQRQELSAKYLEHLLASLKASGLVRVERGAHGGYQLARAPAEISLGEVVRSLEGSLYLVECAESDGLCPRQGVCVTRDVWAQMTAALAQILDGTTMADLVRKQEAKRRGAAAQVMYQI